MPQPLISQLSQHTDIASLRRIIGEGATRPIWWEITGESPKSLDYSAACKTCKYVRQPAQRQTCQSRFIASLRRARETRAPDQYICPINRYTVTVPVVQNGQVQGYFSQCYREQPVPASTLKLSALAVGTTLREMEKGQELKKLSETIQPRCVALSTIHTIHRLISSTLNLEELLPRVARLCCQVLRAQSCAIWLVDHERKRLLPRAQVELRPGKVRTLRALRLGTGLPGRVAATCEAQLSERAMLVPLVEEECLGVIMVSRSAKGQPFGTLDQEILTTLAEQAVVAIRNAQMYENQERVTWGTIKSLSEILDGMDTYSPNRTSHRQVLADVSVAIAQQMKISAEEQRSLQYAALLHDAGRIGIPEEILRKPSKLAPAEFAKVKEHTVKGARLLQPLEILEPAIPIIMHHHERWDGTGYPKGLKKEEIPLGARVLAVANAFEAMVCERPYRESIPAEKAAQEIASHSGTQFDPQVVQAFLALVKSGRMDAVLKEHQRRTGRNGEGA